ncbi:hypothetical protein HBI24_227880 [Parastagonospora nodorum]|nr:hypothetical protein HBH53_250190 [Parastagonospora nodorum]KAH3991783.1 hypothetical protein HBI10_226610 [Parastagonospora nodorum]KAH4009380.1 hypothetical protein HBI13_221330 [Parastagonospora nodorum]KAH4043302.1 hypothetical protein HBH49_235610 [Parastagonospora nodorum]KAH4111677.1 hypothetical protein HBH47_238220 [Parastagonospora nodorum]
MNLSKPLSSLTAVEALRVFDADLINVQQYARSILRRIEEREYVVKEWEYIDPELVLHQAKILDKVPKEQRGPLHGVAVGIKDVIYTKGDDTSSPLQILVLNRSDVPTQYGSSIYCGYQPNLDSSAVAILRAAGETSTTEFGVPNSGPATTNPHDPNRTPVGSSAGSAAAVTDIQVPFSIGVQSGGSIIRPASYIGIFARKPSHNNISTAGQARSSNKFDTTGSFARSIQDLELLAAVFDIDDDESPNEVALEDMSVAKIKTPM